MTKQRIIDNPDQWIITRHGDLVRIKDSEIRIDKNLESIREHLKISFQGKIRFTGKTAEQISKERYDKVWEEVNFDAWLYDEKNKDKVEIVKLERQDLSEAAEAIFKHVKSSKQKWRERLDKKTIDWNLQNWHVLYNEETGQIIYPSAYIDKERSKYKLRPPNLIDFPKIKLSREKHTSTLIFLPGTYGAGSLDQMAEKFPGLKVIHPHSPTLQYDMWHDSQPAPGGQCQGWINITGDAWKLMDTDVPRAYNLYNSPPQKNFEEADQIIHLDYPQLMRAVNYVNEIIEREIAAGIPSEKIFIAGYSQGGLLTLAVALTSQYKLGGFIPLCGLLPRWDKLLVKPSEKNKKTLCLIINNSGDPWVPFWAGKKSYDLLKERGYNVEFKTRPGRGHGWENEDIEEFLTQHLSPESPLDNSNQSKEPPNSYLPWILGGIVIAAVIGATVYFPRARKPKKKRSKKN